MVNFLAFQVKKLYNIQLSDQSKNYCQVSSGANLKLEPHA